MSALIKKTDKPMGIAVQAITFGRMTKYSNMVVRGMFEELRFGKMDDGEVIKLGEALKDLNDLQQLDVLMVQYYVIKHGLNKKLLIDCTERLWTKGMEWRIETYSNLCEEEMVTLCESYQKVNDYFLASRDPLVIELAEKWCGVERLLEILNLRNEKEYESRNIMPSVFGIDMDDPEMAAALMARHMEDDNMEMRHHDMSTN